ncbi:MAG: AbrB/MazE/SpoVT family DNA-binding domain-containing protein [Candidatus Nanoarchaeia archaeon]|nr:AbrB/MazE/SpoVT family DNA-binding domain-containing protein [Candidatus Nanoarchaeia archaeon]
MEKLEITTLSSRGQIVIPQDMRDELNLKIGEKFIIAKKDGIIILKKLELGEFKDFEKVLKKTQSFVKEKGIEQKDLDEAIKRVRKK